MHKTKFSEMGLASSKGLFFWKTQSCNEMSPEIQNRSQARPHNEKTKWKIEKHSAPLKFNQLFCQKHKDGPIMKFLLFTGCLKLIKFYTHNLAELINRIHCNSETSTRKITWLYYSKTPIERPLKIWLQNGFELQWWRSRRFALMNRLLIMMTPIGWKEFNTKAWTVTFYFYLFIFEVCTCTLPSSL